MEGSKYGGRRQEAGGRGRIGEASLMTDIRVVTASYDSFFHNHTYKFTRRCSACTCYLLSLKCGKQVKSTTLNKYRGVLLILQLEHSNTGYSGYQTPAMQCNTSYP